MEIPEDTVLHAPRKGPDDCPRAGSLGSEVANFTSFKHRVAKRKSAGLISFNFAIISLVMLTATSWTISPASAQVTVMQCEDVALLPHELTLTHARDTEKELLDMHTFTKFFTY